MRKSVIKKNRRGQLKLSFGMIFSIILIIFFLVFAFFGIKKFLDTRDEISIASFKKDLQDDIDQMWKSSRGSDDKTYSLPKKVEAVCIQNDEYMNMEILPIEYDGTLLKHVDIGNTLSGSGVVNGRLCFPVIDGKITIWLEKDFGENEITLVRK